MSPSTSSVTLLVWRTRWTIRTTSPTTMAQRCFHSSTPATRRRSCSSARSGPTISRGAPSSTRKAPRTPGWPRGRGTSRSEGCSASSRRTTAPRPRPAARWWPRLLRQRQDQRHRRRRLQRHDAAVLQSAGCSSSTDRSWTASTVIPVLKGKYRLGIEPVDGAPDASCQLHDADRHGLRPAELQRGARDAQARPRLVRGVGRRSVGGRR